MDPSYQKWVRNGSGSKIGPDYQEWVKNGLEMGPDYLQWVGNGSEMVRLPKMGQECIRHGFKSSV